jgi:hypothetical protein
MPRMIGLCIALLVVTFTATVACTAGEEGAYSDAPVPYVGASPVVQIDENMDALVIQISNGHFDRSLYEQQTGDMRLLVRTEGGPYLFSIDDLVDRRELPESGSTVILYSVSAPGRHTMHLALSTPTSATATEETATLDVRPVGGR